MSAPVDAMPLNRSGALPAALAAAAVGLLAAGTLGTVTAVIVGAALYLIGLPDTWAEGIAAIAAAACLMPCAMLARRVWQVERHGSDG